MKIAIIGAGWYGCHLAISLLQAGHQIKVYERSAKPISGASKRNQNRLHLGFHYPRDHQTRLQSKEGYEWFYEHYSHLVEDVSNNYYAIAEEKSLIDDQTYQIIMKGTGLDYEVRNEECLKSKFNNLSSLYECKEKVVRNDLASEFFLNTLSGVIEYNRHVDLSNQLVRSALEDNFDYIIDCSWGTAQKIPGLNYYYEPCIYFYYRNKTEERFALTIMDGKFYSLYPYYDDVFTLTSVEHTPLGQFDDLNDAISCLANAKNNARLIEEKRKIFEKEFEKFYPGFSKDFELDSPEFSMKTKIKSSSDFRGCIVKKHGQFISVFSGKIDTLHMAENEVFSLLESGCDNG